MGICAVFLIKSFAFVELVRRKIFFTLPLDNEKSIIYLIRSLK